MISADGEITDEKGTMRKKILVLVLLLLCVGALITLVIIRSGTPLVDFWSVAGPLSQDKTEIVTAKKLEGVGGECTDRKGVLALYEETNAAGKKVQKVVHLLRGEVIAEVENTDAVAYTVTLYSALEDAAWYAVTEQSLSENPVYGVSLFDAAGKLFAEKKEIGASSAIESLYSPVLDLVRFERDVFRINDDGNAKQAFSLSTFAELPVFDQKVAGYYYHTASDSLGVDCWYIYDSSAMLTAIYRVPTEAQDARSFILSDGTLFTQYVTVEDASATAYTYMTAGVKYKLHHELLSARTGEKNVLKEPNFYITKDGILSDDSELRAQGLNASMENLAFGYSIEEQILDMNAHTLRAALFSNRGKITSFVGDIIPAMYGGGILGVAKNRWIARNLADEYFLLNEWGSVIGRFPSLASVETSLASKLFVHENKIYDWDLSLLYDMEENGVTSFELVGSSVLMRKAEGEVLLYDGAKRTVIALANAGEEKKISIPRDSSLILAEQLVEGTKQFSVYNESGALLATLEAESVEVTAHVLDGKYVAELLVTDSEGVSLYIAATED